MSATVDFAILAQVIASAVVEGIKAATVGNGGVGSVDAGESVACVSGDEARVVERVEECGESAVSEDTSSGVVVGVVKHDAELQPRKDSGTFCTLERALVNAQSDCESSQAVDEVGRKESVSSGGGSAKGVEDLSRHDGSVLAAPVAVPKSPKLWSDMVAESGEGSVGAMWKGKAKDGGAGSDSDRVAFFSKYVRVQAVEDLRRLLERACGHRIPKSALPEVALTRYTAATVPEAFVRGRERLAALATVGDAAVALAVAARGYRVGRSAAELNTLRTKILTNQTMSQALDVTGLSMHLVVAGNVKLGNSKTGATAVEAFAGLLVMHCGVDAVRQFLEYLKL